MSETGLLEDEELAAAPPRVPMRGDLTEGPILKTLVLFSIPALLSNLLQTMGGTINTIWVGRLIGDKAIASTAIGNNISFLSFAFVFGFGMAATVRVGHYFGARDIDGARRVFGTGTGFCVGIALVAALAGWILAEMLLAALSTPAEIHEMSLSYLRVTFLSMPFNTVGMMVSMSLRGAGDARTPFYAMVAQTILGIVLNPLLIVGWGPVPALGIAGSALANLLAGIGAAAIMIGWIYWRDLPLRLRGSEFRYLIPGGPEFGYILSKGLPMGGQMLINGSAAFIVTGLINVEGVLTTAAYGAVLQLWNYIQMPSFAISMAVSAMVAQNVGAQKHGRVGRITIVGIIANCSTTLLLAILLLAFDAPLLSLFLGPGSGAIPIAEHMQLLATWSWVITGVMMIMIGTMRAYGVVWIPLLIMFAGQYIARLGFYYLFYPVMGADALWWAFPFSSVVAVALTLWAYNFGGWRKHRHEAALIAPAAE